MHAKHPMRDGLPPAWADGFGFDEFGPYAEVYIDDATLRMRWIPPGTFTMGSPEDYQNRFEEHELQHEVTLTEGYWLADAPLTQAMWKTVTGENPSHFRGPELPVENVSWNDVSAFIKRLNVLAPQLVFRLPTEAEWEHACRAKNTTRRYGELDAVAWHSRNSGGEPHPVREKQSNRWGLYDMLGNVWEWCADWYGEYQPDASMNPTGPQKGSGRVFRGGSWDSPARFVRAAYRSGDHPGTRDDHLGFRLSRGPAPRPRDLESLRGGPGGAESQEERPGGGADGRSSETENVDREDADAGAKDSYIEVKTAMEDDDVAVKVAPKDGPSETGLGMLLLDSNMDPTERSDLSYLRSEADGRRVYLKHKMTVGRLASSDLPLQNPMSSGRHAAISYSGGGWWIFDLNSRNGTFLNGDKLTLGPAARIRTADILSFGSADESWVVENVSRAAAMAIGPNGHIRAAERGRITIKDVSTSESCDVYLRGDKWLMDARMGVQSTPVHDGDAILVGETTWLLSLPDPLELRSTIPMRMSVLRNPTRGQMEIVLYAGTRAVRLDSRSHNALLGTLASYSAGDGLGPASLGGWRTVEFVCEDIGLTRQILNLYVHRLRASLEQHEIPNAASIVERDDGRIRLRPMLVRVASSDEDLAVPEDVETRHPVPKYALMGLEDAGTDSTTLVRRLGLANNALFNPSDLTEGKIVDEISNALRSCFANTDEVVGYFNACGVRTPRTRGYERLVASLLRKTTPSVAVELTVRLLLQVAPGRVLRRVRRAVDGRARRLPSNAYALSRALINDDGSPRMLARALIAFVDREQVPLFEPRGRRIEPAFVPADHMQGWFLERFGDPAIVSPRDIRGEGYFYRFGGPYDALEVLTEEFGGRYSEEQIAAATEALVEQGGPDWAAKAPL